MSNNSTKAESKSSPLKDSFSQSVYSRPTALEIAQSSAEGSENMPKKNLWHSLLDTVGKRKDVKQAHVLVLGDRGAGKRSLIKQINKPFLKSLGIQQAMEEQQLGINFAHFDCSYFYLKDGVVDHSLTEENTYSRINVWFVSDDEVGHILTKVLKPEDLEFTFAIIMPDMAEPWDIMNQCERWMKVLKESILKLTPKLELKTLEKLRERIIDLHKTFEEP